jgi:phosphoribosylanthranilate isomerase
MIIKVCGMREADNIRALDELAEEFSIIHSPLSINLIGFIFWSGSKRYVSQLPSYLPTHCKRVGVFVDEDIEQVKRIAANYQLDYIQLHGKESPAYINQLKKTFSIVHYPLSIIKAFNIADPTDFEQTKAYEGIVDLFLFDTKGKSVGGNGEQFDWNILDSYDGDTPFLLSGGIGPDDAPRIKEIKHPKCIGIDLNSRFEVTPGVKDISKLKTFIQAL